MFSILADKSNLRPAWTIKVFKTACGHVIKGVIYYWHYTLNYF